MEPPWRHLPDACTHCSSGGPGGPTCLLSHREQGRAWGFASGLLLCLRPSQSSCFCFRWPDLMPALGRAQSCLSFRPHPLQRHDGRNQKTPKSPSIHPCGWWRWRRAAPARDGLAGVCTSAARLVHSAFCLVQEENSPASLAAPGKEYVGASGPKPTFPTGWVLSGCCMAWGLVQIKPGASLTCANSLQRPAGSDDALCPSRLLPACLPHPQPQYKRF